MYLEKMHFQMNQQLILEPKEYKQWNKLKRDDDRSNVDEESNSEENIKLKLYSRICKRSTLERILEVIEFASISQLIIEVQWSGA